jgi:CrcB protein
VVLTLSLERGAFNINLRLLLAVGFCGGFTTMSTFSYETLTLARDGGMLAAAGNAGSTLIVCVVAVWLGSVVARGL